MLSDKLCTPEPELFWVFPLSNPYFLIEAMRMVMVLCEGAPGERLAKLFSCWLVEGMVCPSSTLHDDTSTGECPITKLAKLLLPLVLFIQRDKIQ